MANDLPDREAFPGRSDLRMGEETGGLDNMLHSAPMARRTTTATAPAAVVNNVGPAFGPNDLYTFYNKTGLLNLNKPTGVTSRRVVDLVQRMGRRTERCRT